ncbi:hypothetical protein EVG20_g1323 [Dentipellis fragilis]|uniref:Uncharacterized protein n=1 Tax=Dentipellis fragilis TaxID=205917 RepID=A0A4Y9ZD48_9AGAM|nr:hypothetical protein EVG20_g1323 [Dentipellis fragilis]
MSDNTSNNTSSSTSGDFTYTGSGTNDQLGFSGNRVITTALATTATIPTRIIIPTTTAATITPTPTGRLTTTAAMGTQSTPPRMEMPRPPTRTIGLERSWWDSGKAAADVSLRIPQPSPASTMSYDNDHSSGGDYTYNRSGTNKEGNHYCSRNYGNGSNTYHYSNRDGGYYYSNPDGSKYYNNGKGYSRYISPKGYVKESTSKTK